MKPASAQPTPAGLKYQKSSRQLVGAPCGGDEWKAPSKVWKGEGEVLEGR